MKIGDKNLFSNNIEWSSKKLYLLDICLLTSAYVKTDTNSDVSRGFSGIPFSTGEFRAGAPKDIIVNFEQQFSVINMYRWHG